MFIEAKVIRGPWLSVNELFVNRPGSLKTSQSQMHLCLFKAVCPSHGEAQHRNTVILRVIYIHHCSQNGREYTSRAKLSSLILKKSKQELLPCLVREREIAVVPCTWKLWLRTRTCPTLSQYHTTLISLFNVLNWKLTIVLLSLGCCTNSESHYHPIQDQRNPRIRAKLFVISHVCIIVLFVNMLIALTLSDGY